MFERLSISLVLRACAALAAASGLGAGQGWAQATPQTAAVADPFAAWHKSLASTADKVLAAPVHPAREGLANPLNFHPVAYLTVANTKASHATAAMTRVQQLRPIIEPILREERVPTELAGMVLVESGGRLMALSPKGARGLWQFMPDTARRYGLTVTRERDERLDIERSTRAAARYLRDLYGRFGDWQLALAAYNAGTELVQRAIARNGTRNFSKLSSARSIPPETVKYVPAVMDATRMFTPNLATVSLHGGGVWKVYADTHPGNQR